MPYAFTVILDGSQNEPDAIHGDELTIALLERIEQLCTARSIHVPGWTFDCRSVEFSFQQPMEPNDEEDQAGR